MPTQWRFMIQTKIVLFFYDFAAQVTVTDPHVNLFSVQRFPLFFAVHHIATFILGFGF